MEKHGTEKKRSISVIGATLLCLALAACGEKATPSTASQATHDAPTKDTPSKKSVSEIVQCPVCGLSFPKNKAVEEHEHSGKKYFFYLEDHYREFSKNPEKYLSK